MLIPLADGTAGHMFFVLYGQWESVKPIEAFF
jgi:hypothetical protein